MLSLEQLEPGQRIAGLTTSGPAKILAVIPYSGASAVRVVFEEESTGRTVDRVVFESEGDGFDLLDDVQRWTFDADSRLFRLVLEAERLHLAYLFDPQLAVSVSRVEPLPHQIDAVYDAMLPRQPLRFLLADDPGAGKTIMTGLLIKELLLRADIERCLIVVPAALDVQWQDELHDKFGLDFSLIGREQIQGALGNVFTEKQFIIGRIDLLKQDDQIARLLETSWDLVVFDEAHKLSATYLPGPHEIKETARFRLGKVLRERTRHLLLLTATPHSGKQGDFELLLSLLDPDRFSGKPHPGNPQPDVSDLMHRMLKEDLVDFEGRPLFPERYAQTVSYTLSAQELALYDAVTHYVRQEMTRADENAQTGGSAGKRVRAVVGFALTLLQRRLASSPEAILRSLERRRDRLASALERHRQDQVTQQSSTAASSVRPLQLDLGLGLPLRKMRIDPDELEIDLDERPEGEAQEIVDRASAARSLADLEREVTLLTDLAEQARALRAAEVDAKWRELRTLLSDPEMFGQDGARHKIVVFTEHRDTLTYLVSRIQEHLGRDEEVAFIHGSLNRDERLREQARFIGDHPELPEASVLVATDAAGEGINLQVAHLLVNYDLPWNPNRLEQRFGRIHRFGQKEPCFNWNLVASNTREGDVYRTLFEKLEEARAALGGKVFDVLGQVFADRPLRDILLEVIREDDPARAAQVDRDVEAIASLERYREIVARQALAHDVLSPHRLEEIRREREQAESGRLVPHYIAGFFIDAFRDLGGVIEEREPGRYALSTVPVALRRRGRGVGESIQDHYTRVCFDKDHITRELDAREARRGERREARNATFIAPGHPLFDSTLESLRERHRGLLSQGAVFLDPREGAETTRLLVSLQTEMSDDRSSSGGNRRPASANLWFIEVDAAGNARDAGPAPHLDYRPADDRERESLLPVLAEDWIGQGLHTAERFAVEQLMPIHLDNVRRQREDTVLPTRRATDERLTTELLRLDEQIAELRRQAREGRQPKMNVDRSV